jgi:hypothetical protein
MARREPKANRKGKQVPPNIPENQSPAKNPACKGQHAVPGAGLHWECGRENVKIGVDANDQ